MRIIVVLLLWVTSVVAGYGQGHERIDSLKKHLATYADSIPAYKNKVDISVSNTSLKEFLRAVAETHDLNLSLDKIPDYLITNTFESVTVEELIVFVCYTYHLEVKVLNNILILYPYTVPDYVSFEYDGTKDLLSFHFIADTLKHVAKEISNMTPYNMVLGQQVRNQVVHGFIQSLPFREAMKQLGASNDLIIEESSNKVFFVSPVETEVIDQEAINRNSNQSSRSSRRTTSRSGGSGSFRYKKNDLNQDKLDINAMEIGIAEAIKSVCEDMGIGYFFLEEPKGMLDCYLLGVTFEDFLTIALSTAEPNFTFSINNGIYMIGSPKNLNMYEARVFTFKNRSAENAIESIPPSLKGDLEILAYPDLNSLIVTGSGQRIDKLISFLEQIDKPVANVLIEVMVVVINRASLLEVGVTAGIADSLPPPSSGAILPGMDLDLSSQSLNNFLGAIDRRGVINLGKVTPTFYASIEALEQSNHLDLQSTPKLSTVNGHEATLTIGESRYYKIETANVTGGVSSVITTSPRYDKVEANLDLKIKPFVSYNEDVTLTIAFESSDFIESAIDDGTPPGNATRKFESKIRIKNEEMIVVGGLEQQSTTKSSSGLPGIAKLPILKWFFGKNSEANTENKLLVFIKPTIVY